MGVKIRQCALLLAISKVLFLKPAIVFILYDRFHFGYQEGDHTAILIVERGIGVTKIYCEDLAWTYPFENEIIPPQKKDEIIKNIQESLRFMNIQYEIVK